jgi:ABC-type sugar transport system ATPase subunit
VAVGPMALPLTPSQRTSLTTASVIIGLRPDDLVLDLGDDTMTGTVEVVEELGSDAFVYVASDLVAPAMLAIRVDGREAPARGARVGVRVLPGRMHVFDGATQLRLP